MATIAYLRVSTEAQDSQNQRFALLQYANSLGLKVDNWVSETISSRKALEHRKLGELLNSLSAGDVLLISESSRLGRSMFEVMEILNRLMKADVKVYSAKERYELGSNISSKVLAFAFGLAGEIERDLISARTKEALARRKSEGQRLGRPPGSLSANVKLAGREAHIQQLLEKQISVSGIARILGVNRSTVTDFIRTRKLK